MCLHKHGLWVCTVPDSEGLHRRRGNPAQKIPFLQMATLVLFLLSAFPSCPCTGHNHLNVQLSVPAASCKLGASVACVGSLPLHSSSPAFALWPDI